MINYRYEKSENLYYFYDDNGNPMGTSKNLTEGLRERKAEKGAEITNFGIKESIIVKKTITAMKDALLESNIITKYASDVAWDIYTVMNHPGEMFIWAIHDCGSFIHFPSQTFFKECLYSTINIYGHSHFYIIENGEFQRVTTEELRKKFNV